MIAMIDLTIPKSSIQDCIRLCKYTGEKHRLILVKLSRTCEVSSLLSQRKKLKRVGLVRQSKLGKRINNQLIMKSRWDFIQSGTNRKDIKIRGNYVNNLGKGSVVNNYNYK